MGPSKKVERETGVEKNDAIEISTEKKPAKRGRVANLSLYGRQRAERGSEIWASFALCNRCVAMTPRGANHASGVIAMFAPCLESPRCFQSAMRPAPPRSVYADGEFWVVA